MGHAGMAATAVRYLRSVGAGTTAPAPLDPLRGPISEPSATTNGCPSTPANSGACWGTSRRASPS